MTRPQTLAWFLLPLLCCCCALGAAAGCAPQRKPLPKEGSGHVILTPLAEPAKHVARLRQLVYVPAYSAIYLGFEQQTVEIATTLSIRNVSANHALIVHSVKYFDSSGHAIDEYVPKPATLAPMSTADFVVQRHDTSGGPGANFIVDWSSADDIDDPVIETIMIGHHGSAGFSFSSVGRPLPKATAELLRQEQASPGSPVVKP